MLNQVNGSVRPGEMCALMGASGAGKSTLLDVLAGRKNTGVIEGEILYNHSPKLTASAYVMQDNVHGKNHPPNGCIVWLCCYCLVAVNTAHCIFNIRACAA